jgi:hypothetical protein
MLSVEWTRLKRTTFVSIVLLTVVGTQFRIAAEREISHGELLDKISGFWIGQLVGNYDVSANMNI